MWLEVTVHGKAAHAANPGSGLNAFEKTAELVTALQSLKEEFGKPDRTFRMPPDIERQPTINIGGVFSGTTGDKVNTVPAQLTFSIDRRIPPNERLHQAESELRGAIKTACDNIPKLKVDVKSTLRIEPCLVDTEEPLVQRVLPISACDSAQSGEVGTDWWVHRFAFLRGRWKITGSGLRSAR